MMISTMMFRNLSAAGMTSGWVWGLSGWGRNLAIRFGIKTASDGMIDIDEIIMG
jgi:hypothetical protein